MWLIIEKSRELANTWTAHVLNLDLVTQGKSVEHARLMAREVIAMVLEDDAKAGLDPFDRTSAPDEAWERVHRAIRRGRRWESLSAEERKRATRVVSPMVVSTPDLSAADKVFAAPLFLEASA